MNTLLCGAMYAAPGPHLQNKCDDLHVPWVGCSSLRSFQLTQE